MRVFALFAFALPVFVAAQLACDADTTALCCFDTEDATPDSFAQLSALPDFENVQLPVDVQGSIGLLCTEFDASCSFTPMCCSNNNFNGTASFGCAAQPAAAASSDSSDSSDASASTDSSDSS